MIALIASALTQTTTCVAQLPVRTQPSVAILIDSSSSMDSVASALDDLDINQVAFEEERRGGLRYTPFWYSLQNLVELDDPYAAYFEHQYLVFIHQTLTKDWPLVQKGHDDDSSLIWKKIFMVLELDTKGKVVQL